MKTTAMTVLETEAFQKKAISESMVVLAEHFGTSVEEVATAFVNGNENVVKWVNSLMVESANLVADKINAKS